MQEAFVKMTKGGVKAYYSALKEQRREIALFYEESGKPISELMRIFKVSRKTIEKALEENEIEVDPTRNRAAQPGCTYQQHRCPKCKKSYRHYCGEGPEGAQDARLSSLEQLENKLTGLKAQWGRDMLNDELGAKVRELEQRISRKRDKLRERETLKAQAVEDRVPSLEERILRSREIVSGWKAQLGQGNDAQLLAQIKDLEDWIGSQLS